MYVHTTPYHHAFIIVIVSPQLLLPGLFHLPRQLLPLPGLLQPPLRLLPQGHVVWGSKCVC